MPTSDDLTGVLLPADASDIGFHQGVIVEWNAQTGTNVINVLGSLQSDLKMLNITEALVLQPGHVVGLLRFRNSFFILGRIVTPNTPEFFTGVMPNLAYTLWPVNSDAALQTNTVDSAYYPKFVGAFIVSHSKLSFEAVLNLSGGTPAGNWRLQWYLAHPGNIANPPNGTLIHQATVSSTPTAERGTYTWPTSRRGTLVYLSFEPRMTAGIGGSEWVACLPRYLYGHD